MKVSWEKQRSKWWIFQYAMFEQYVMAGCRTEVPAAHTSPYLSMIVIKPCGRHSWWLSLGVLLFFHPLAKAPQLVLV